ncbi:MAG TPA: prohibitin family protein [Deltaproteobacteria bacterium]|nr:prohibitin family protein [Deltaproteobacteria bacterium]
MRRSMLIPLGLLALLATGCPKVVEDGEVGVVTSFGDIDPEEKTDPGLYLSIPLLRSLSIYNVKTLEMKETMQVPTADEMLVGLDVSVFVHLDDSRVAELRSSVTGDPFQTLLVPTLRSQTREAAGGFKVEDFYNQSKRALISSAIKAGMMSKMESRGLVIEDILIRDIVPPQAFQRAVEKKLEQKQRAEQKQFELEQAKLNREIEKTRAEGAALAMAEVQEKLTDRYLQYLWIQSVAENPNIEKVYIATELGLPLFKEQE